MIKKIVFALTFFFLLSTFNLPANAIYFGGGDNVYLSADNKFNETVIVAGEKLTIDSDIQGDLICAGKDITITGTVMGDIYCVGQNITYKEGSVSGDLLTAGQNIVISSSVGRDLAAGGSNVTLNSNVSRNAILAGSILSQSAESTITGNLDYYISDNSTTKFSGLVTGQSNKHLTETNEVDTESVSAKGAFGGFKVFSVLASLVLAFSIYYFARPFILKASETIVAKPVATFFIGLSVLIVTPIAFFILLVTIVGLPLAFVILFLYIIALITASIYPAFVFGRLILTKTKIGGNDSLFLLVGVVATQLLGIIPVIGWIFSFVFLCLGLGGFFQNYLPVAKKNEVKEN